MKQFLVITFLAVALSVLVFGQVTTKKSSSKPEDEIMKEDRRSVGPISGD